MKFFDRMKDSISSAGTGVSQKVSVTADTMKLNNQTRSNEKEIEKLIYQVGLKCVQLHLDQTDSEYEELFEKIRHLQELNKSHQSEIQRLAEDLELQEQIRQQELKDRQAQREQEQKEKEELKQLQKQKCQEEERQQAESIRQAELEKQIEIQKELDATTKLCSKCGQRNDLDSKFCVYCGASFLTDATEAEQ